MWGVRRDGLSFRFGCALTHARAAWRALQRQGFERDCWECAPSIRCSSSRAARRCPATGPSLWPCFPAGASAGARGAAGAQPSPRTRCAAATPPCSRRGSGAIFRHRALLDPCGATHIQRWLKHHLLRSQLLDFFKPKNREPAPPPKPKFETVVLEPAYNLQAALVAIAGVEGWQGWTVPAVLTGLLGVFLTIQASRVK